MTKNQKRWTLIAVILGSGIVFLDTSVVNLALPRIAQELPSPFLRLAPLEAQAYISFGYFLTLSALLILGGALTDYHGRKKMFGIGLAGFLLTSLLCGLAPNIELLIVFRILQGAAGALVVPGSLSIITASFEGEEQGRAFGIWAGASAATTIIGPFVGGVLVNSISWRAAFLLNVPLLLLAGYATVRHVPESKDEAATGQLDWLGSLVVAVAVAGLAFGATRGQQLEWRNATVPIISLVIGGVAAIVFPIMMRKSRNPLVPLDLFSSRNFSVTNLSTFLIYAALYVTLTLQAVFLVGTLGYNPPAAGIAGIPASLLLVLFSTRFGRLAARKGPRVFMSLGPAIMMIGFLYLARLPSTSRPWVFGTGDGQSLLPPSDYFVDLLPALLIFGSGLAMMVAPLTTALMTSVAKHRSGLASAINNAISRVGSPLVFAVVFLFIVPGFYSSLQEKVPTAPVSSPQFRATVSPLNPPKPGTSPQVAAAAKEASTDAFHVGMVVAAALMLAGALVNLRISNAQALEGSGQEAPPDAGRSTEPSHDHTQAES